MSIIPGIENFAPDRTETSSGFVVEPNCAPATRSSLRTCAIISSSMACGSFRPVVVPEVARRRGDRETRRHRQAGVGHLRQAGTLASEQVLHRPVAVRLAVGEPYT